MAEKDSQSQLESALAECGRLHKENVSLRRSLSEHGISLPAPPETVAGTPSRNELLASFPSRPGRTAERYIDFHRPGNRSV